MVNVKRYLLRRLFVASRASRGAGVCSRKQGKVGHAAHWFVKRYRTRRWYASRLFLLLCTLIARDIRRTRTSRNIQRHCSAMVYEIRIALRKATCTRKANGNQMFSSCFAKRSDAAHFLRFHCFLFLDITYVTSLCGALLYELARGVSCSTQSENNGRQVERNKAFPHRDQSHTLPNGRIENAIRDREQVQHTSRKLDDNCA